MAEPNESHSAETRHPGLLLALVPVLALVALLAINVFLFDGYPHLPLVLATAVAALVGVRLGYSWESLEEGMIEGIQVSMKAVLILMIIGVLIGLWIAGGIVPSLIYYGLKVMSPGWFLPATCLVCAVVSISTGSSWTTAGTVGVALIGIGDAMGISLSMTAGAVVSGAYFGDKLSPLSDTTNLAPAVAGSDLFDHIRHMIWTTIPALLISLVLYLLLGWMAGGQAADQGSVVMIQETLKGSFVISPLLLLPAVIVVIMVVLKLPALPAMLAGALIGALLALTVQSAPLGDVFNVAFDGFAPDTGSDQVNELLEKGGLMGMMNTVALILCAMSFGGVMEKAGMLKAIAESILSLARSTGSLITATVLTCFGMNIIAPDQYLSIVVPGRMYRDAYRKQGLDPVNLSRTLEDAGTLSSPLIPWNTCGAFMGSVLAVGSFEFLAYAFLNLLTPVIAILYGFTGWKIIKVES